MSEYKNFTSLPPDKEHQFVVYEKQSVETGKKAMKIGMIVAAIFGLITVAIVFAFPAPTHGHQMADDDMGNLKRATPKEETSADKPAPAPAPESAGAEESSDTAAGEGSDDEAGDGDDGAADGEAAEGDSSGDESE